MISPIITDLKNCIAPSWIKSAGLTYPITCKGKTFAASCDCDAEIKPELCIPGLMFFEDNGTRASSKQIDKRIKVYDANLKLCVWLNGSFDGFDPIAAANWIHAKICKCSIEGVTQLKINTISQEHFYKRYWKDCEELFKCPHQFYCFQITARIYIDLDCVDEYEPEIEIEQC